MFDNELNNTNMYLSALKDSDKRDNQNNLFNLLAGLFLPATLISGILGMNDLFEKDKEIIHIMQFPITRYMIFDLALVIILSLVFWILMCLNKTVLNIIRKNIFISSFILIATIAVLYFIIDILK